MDRNTIRVFTFVATNDLLMETPLIIGYSETDLSRASAQGIIELLKAKDKTAALQEVVETDYSGSDYNGLYGQLDVLPVPLDKVGTELPSDIIIAGLSARTDPSFVLISKTAELLVGPLHTQKKLVIRCRNKIVAQQMTKLLPDIRLISEKKGEAKDSAEIRSNCQLIPAYTYIGDLKVRFPHSKKLQPRELIPIAGQGVTAFLTTKDNIKARRLLKLIHDRTTASCTNVERRIIRESGMDPQQEIAVYCALDPAQNFHLFGTKLEENIDGISELYRFSQRTSIGLVEKMLEALS